MNVTDFWIIVDHYSIDTKFAIATSAGSHVVVGTLRRAADPGPPKPSNETVISDTAGGMMAIDVYSISALIPNPVNESWPAKASGLG